MYDDITGIILSGGKSTRMGENKSFLKIGGQTVIEHVCQMMKSIFGKVIIITNEPELYQNLGVEIFTDIYKNVGPIAGIHSGLFHSTTERNFIISCDIPLMNADMIKSIVEYPADNEIVVPFADGFLQQLCGVYCRSLVPLIDEIIRAEKFEETRDNIQVKRKCKVHQLVNFVDSTIIRDIVKLIGYTETAFLNMNSPEDYEKIRKIIAS
jgi:molybdopterin-guanine dinucleotide biosynthesis protein A